MSCSNLIGGFCEVCRAIRFDLRVPSKSPYLTQTLELQCEIRRASQLGPDHVRIRVVCGFKSCALTSRCTIAMPDS